MKKMKIVWKRFLLWSGAAAMALTSIGCNMREDAGPQPYVSMETIGLLETAQEEVSAKAPGALSEQLGAPSKYAADPILAADGRLAIQLDAVVTMPDVDAMPICRVAAGEFDEVFVNRAFAYFCGDTPMYDRANLSNTREEIQKWIDGLKRDLANNDFPDGDENVEYWREIYTKEPASYEKRLMHATDDLGAPVKEAVFGITDKGNGGAQETLHLVDTQNPPWNISFAVSNNIEYPFNETRRFDDAYGGSYTTASPRSMAALGFMDNTNGGTGGRWLFVRDVEWNDSAAELPFAPMEAANKVNETLLSLGLSDILYPVDAMVLTLKDSGKYAYGIDLRRKRNGIDVRSPAYSSYVGNPEDGFAWHYETATAYVDEEGVFYFRWEAPLTMLETTVESAKLLPFADIMRIAAGMLPVVLMQDAYYWDYYAAMQVEIEEISLSLQRISDQNSISSGLLIPVWNFWGSTSNHFADGTADTRDSDDLNERETQGYSMLSINAVDGSIINNQKGY